MVKCPNCGSFAQTLIDREVNYDHSFSELKCEDCGLQWVIEYDIDGNLAGYQYKKDGIYYIYSSKGELRYTL